MRDSLVSVVIPTYRRPTFLLNAVQTVLRQGHAKLEILVIDDASGDSTEQVVSTIADERVRYIRHSATRGPSAARNTGVRAAAGDFIAFLDDDDCWRPDKLSRQLRVIDGYEAVLSGALVNGRYLRLHGKAEVSLDDLRKGNGFPPSGLLVRATAIREVWFDERLRQGEDWDVYIRLALRGPIAYVNEPLVLLSDGDHQRATNSAKNMPLPTLEKRMDVVKKHKDFFGAYWFRRHSAAVVLSYLRARAEKRAQLRYAIKKYGLVPVVAVLMAKLTRAWRRMKADALARLW